MTGPEHYREAESWLYKAENSGARMPPETSGYCTRIAQVHATLALAAATGLGTDKPPLDDQQAWIEAASEWKRPGQ